MSKAIKGFLEKVNGRYYEKEKRHFQCLGVDTADSAGIARNCWDNNLDTLSYGKV